MEVSRIRQLAISAGLREARRWNISSALGRSHGRAVRVDKGWLLTDSGRRHLIDSGLIVDVDGQPVPVVTDLRTLLPSITNQNVVDFLEEAIECFERKLYRAAVVLTWVGAVALLQDYVVKYHLTAFNAEARRRDTKWKNAKNADDLSRLKEYEFLNILEAISVIGHNVKQELQNLCLTLRNACGHPNSFKISRNRAAAHIEILVLNVFSVYA